MIYSLWCIGVLYRLIKYNLSREQFLSLKSTDWLATLIILFTPCGYYCDNGYHIVILNIYIGMFDLQWYLLTHSAVTLIWN